MKKLLAIIVATLLFAGCNTTDKDEVLIQTSFEEESETSIVYEDGEITPEDLSATINSEVNAEKTQVMDEYDGVYWESILEAAIETEEELEIIYQDAIEHNYNVAVSVNGERLKIFIKQKSGEVDDVMNEIYQGNADIEDGSNTWNSMLITGLDMLRYEEILAEIQEHHEEFYELVRIQEYEEKFAVWIEPSTYCVMEGETLAEIAEKKRTTVEELLELNPEVAEGDLELHYHLKLK